MWQAEGRGDRSLGYGARHCEGPHVTMTSEVRRSDTAGRYEIYVDGTLAGFTEFVADEADVSIVIMPHTEIDRNSRGHGLAEVLVRGALDDLRARDKRVEAKCPFVARFIAENPDYQDMLVA
jgi:predicted GNAT family acetyltransferase